MRSFYWRNLPGENDQRLVHHKKERGSSNFIATNAWKPKLKRKYAEECGDHHPERRIDEYPVRGDGRTSYGVRRDFYPPV